MRVLHVSSNSGGYEQVKLLANRVNRTNHLSVVQKENGEVYWTGGFLFPDTPGVRALFDARPKEEHYAFASLLKVDPFEKDYYEED